MRALLLFWIVVELLMINWHLDEINITLKGAIHGQDTTHQN